MSETTTTHSHAHPVALDPAARGFEAAVDRYRTPALIAAAGGFGVLLLGLLVGGAERFFESYLYGYLFWCMLSLGCLGVLMLQHLVGGGWGLAVRRVIEAGTRNLPLLALLVIPILLGMKFIYAWTNPDINSHLPGFKHTWLQPGFFVLRTVIYFGVWIGLAYLLNTWSHAEDRTGNPYLGRRMEMISGPGIVLFALALTGAVFDWVMSLDPEWYSTMFGLIFVAGAGLSTFTFCILVLARVRDVTPMNGLLNTGIFHDLGNLTMAFTMLWAYLNFSQFLIIWSGNLAEEVPYYFYRTSKGWRYMGLALVLFHFAVPFALLIWRRTKRTVSWLTTVALLILFMRFVDLKWVTGPSFARPLTHGSVDANQLPPFQIGYVWMDIAAAVGIGGIWIFAFIYQLKRHPLLPANDPRLAEAVEAAHAHH